jgi:hypothetical protein
MNARFGKRAVCVAVIMACDGDYSHTELQQRRIVGRLFTNRCYHEQDALEVDRLGVNLRGDIPKPGYSPIPIPIRCRVS